MSLVERSVKLPVSYRYTLELPSVPAPLLLCLHGYGQTVADALHFGRLLALDWPIAALQAPHPHHQTVSGKIVGAGFGWVSSFGPEEDIENHHAFLRHVIQELFDEGVTSEPRAFLFGFSQSVSLNYRFAAAYPDYVRGVVAVAGAAPSDWSASAPEPNLPMPVLHVAPSADPAYPPSKTATFKRQLQARCTDLTWHEEPGGHRVPSAAYGVVRDWLERKA
ncbi:phospholipase [soil metagenome]